MRQRYFFATILCLMLIVLNISCLPKRTRSKTPEGSSKFVVPRADPGFVQQLERMSMLAQSVDMAKVVSGSELPWRSGATQPAELLSFADVWLAIHPLTLLGDSRTPAFSQLNSMSFRTVLRELGARGIYLAPVSGTGNLWGKDEGVYDKTGENVVQYSFSDAAGSERSYKSMMMSLVEYSLLLGSDLMPAATGIGPDFFLAARNLREYPGIYCMVEIPQKLWDTLPKSNDEFDCHPLSQEEVQALHQQGLLANAARDVSGEASSTGGWAATGEVKGIDGHTRRWVYRYYQNPAYPVLNWEDPSQAAHRILSASAVRQVGLMGQALIGLRFKGFQGLEIARTNGNPDMQNAFSIEPALTAAQSMSRQIKRYGGFSWLRDDNLTLEGTRSFLQGQVDYAFDNAFSPAAEHALLTGDTTLAKFMADEMLRLGVDSSRLVHTLANQDGVNYTLPHLQFLALTKGDQRASTLAQTVTKTAKQQAATYFQNNMLYSTSAGIAAMALGLPPHEIPENKKNDVYKGHMLLVFFKAMQPGILMLNGQDLVGALPLHPNLASSGNDSQAFLLSRGSYALSSSVSSSAISPLGVPKTQTLYSFPDDQTQQKGSFVRMAGFYAKKRASVSLSHATLIAKPETKNKGTIALLSELPEKSGYVLAVTNFSQSRVTETIPLGKAAGKAGSVSLLVGDSGSFSVQGSSIQVELAPWQGRAFLLGKAPQLKGAIQEAIIEEALGPVSTPKAGKKPNIITMPKEPDRTMGPVSTDMKPKVKHTKDAQPDDDQPFKRVDFKDSKAAPPKQTQEPLSEETPAPVQGTSSLPEQKDTHPAPTSKTEGSVAEGEPTVPNDTTPTQPLSADTKNEPTADMPGSSTNDQGSTPPAADTSQTAKQDNKTSPPPVVDEPSEPQTPQVSEEEATPKPVDPATTPVVIEPGPLLINPDGSPLTTSPTATQQPGTGTFDPTAPKYQQRIFPDEQDRRVEELMENQLTKKRRAQPVKINPKEHETIPSIQPR